MDGKTTNCFKYEKGVQQGNPLSPLLFNLFINDIFDAIKNDASVSLDDQNPISALMYADDLILLATSPEELQKSLDGLSEYCEKWKMQVNIKKTKCMTFSKGSNIKQETFKINNKIVDNTREYKYLGININAKNCSFSPTLTNLSNKATRAIYAITSKLPIKSVPVKTLLKLFDSCVAPILTYGSEIWAPYMDHDWSKWDNTPIERVHTQFLKRVLGVNRSTTNHMVRGELGRHSLQERILKRNINYIAYVFSKDPQDENQGIEFIEANQGIVFVEENQNTNVAENIEVFTKTNIKKGIREYFDQEWKLQLQNFTKTDCYKQLKNSVKFEDYLSKIHSRKLRVSMAKFRLSDHVLMIETGKSLFSGASTPFLYFLASLYSFTVKNRYYYINLRAIHATT